MIMDIIPGTMKRSGPNGCIEWAGKLRNGRPAAMILGMQLFRALCWEKHGPPPPNSHAAHTCDNRICINAEHSEWQAEGTNNPTKHEIGDRQISKLEIGGVSVTIKRRRSNKGDGRVVSGWCTTFRRSGKQYKSGAYGSREAAIKWAEKRIT